ncbi:hypothetical protein HLRTI_002995 [Halorhabdus tiamatea SARL4B]|uniref:Uncharacterized protein n=1 Tax=Halorhabdus tiamatea SARL4B TaxID=1033806 RepID=U2F3Y8_9EURY|nr:hypothetical protein [Halorhabdus tiamatea]ERJ05050.1 hypothetical protein HLRTI_002995 [Halorhabdus tiamatea SARL4B]
MAGKRSLVRNFGGAVQILILGFVYVVLLSLGTAFTWVKSIAQAIHAKPAAALRRMRPAGRQ